MKWNPSQDFVRFSVMILISVLSGAGSGAMAGWVSGSMHRQVVYRSEPVEMRATSTASSASSTVSTEPKLTVVQVDQVPPDSIVPPVFAHQETSVASIYLKPGKSVRVFRNEDLIGQAVAVTSDGWFVTPLDLIGQHKLADLMLWYKGKSYPLQRGVVDRRGSVAFLHVDSKDTRAPSFARFQDVTRGLSVWIERKSGNFESALITALSQETDGLIGVSSDISARRPSLNITALKQDVGSPIWASNGSLIGLMVAGKDGRANFISSSAWAPSLFGIFSDGIVKHAALGIRVIDLSTVRLVTPIEGVPERGVWIVEDGKNPAIAPGSPAEKAGLKEGDVITEVDRDILDGRVDLAEILIQYKPNTSVTLKVVRNGKTIQLPVTLGSEVVSEEMK